jgi:D-glycero-alpha-D-manno-heptose 1-phosphate guanylyltransferase
MRDFDRYGTVDLGSDGIIMAFKEKQYCSEGLINGGVYAIDLRSNLFDGMPDKFSFEKEVLEPLCTERRLSGLVQQGYFIDIGIPEDYSKADSEPELLRHPSGLLGIIQALEGFDTLLLDRDGVINRLRQGDYVKTIEEFEWLPGVKQALKIAAEKFKGIYVMTNQRGVGRGLMSMDALNEIHTWMCRVISDAGGRIDGVYVCTAVSDDDPRRKPNTGMFADLLRDHPEVEAEKTIMIGDSASDREFARDSGISFFII